MAEQIVESQEKEIKEMQEEVAKLNRKGSGRGDAGGSSGTRTGKKE